MAAINPGMFAGLTYGTAMANKDLDKAAEVYNGKPLLDENFLDPRDKRATHRGIDQTPVQTSFDIPYEQYASQQVGSIGDAYSDRAAQEAFSAREHLMSSNDDVATSERYQQLLQKREEIRAKIVKLRANIDYQKKLRAQEMARDPMWDIAKQEYIMKGDATQLNNIMGRFENEKTREANRTSEANAKQESFIKVYRNKQRALDWAMQEYLKDTEKPENKRAVFSAYQDLNDAASDAGANVLKDEQFIQNKYGVDLRQMLNLDNIGSMKTDVPAGTTVANGSTATQDLDNFKAAKDSGNLAKMSKAYKAAKEGGKVNGNELNQMRNDLDAVYQQKKDAYDKDMESWNFADKILQKWNEDKVHDTQDVELFRKTYGNRASWKKYIDVGLRDLKKVGEDKKPKAPVKDW